MLSEEIFEFSKNQMTSSQIKELKQQMSDDFKLIFNLCVMVLERFIQNPEGIKLSLVKSGLETFYAFLNWIPLFYIFSTQLIELCLMPLLDHNHFRNLTIKCLTEIVLIPVAGNTEEENKQSREKLLILFSNFIQKIHTIIPCDVSLLNERGKIAKSTPKNLTSFDFLCQVFKNIKIFHLFLNTKEFDTVFHGNDHNSHDLARKCERMARHGCSELRGTNAKSFAVYSEF